MDNPIQPLYLINDVIRFKENKIVNDLLDFATPLGFDMNKIARSSYTQTDREQFAQLIGYSLSGFGSLSYASDDVYGTAYSMYHDTAHPSDAKIAYLEKELNAIKKGLLQPIAHLYGTHPGNLVDGAEYE